MPKRFGFIMNFVWVCAELIWDIRSLAVDDISIWLCSYFKTYSNYS